MYLVVIQSVATATAGSRLRWQRMERYGSLSVPLQTPEPGPQPAHALTATELAASWIHEARSTAGEADVAHLHDVRTPGLPQA
jgi:hypothetical protein